MIYISDIQEDNCFMKKTIHEYYEQEKALYKSPSRIKCFLSALDQKLDGNKIYDWYWWHIWSNITKPFNKIKDSSIQNKYNKQRIKFGVSEQDCWSIPDWLLDTMYNALQNFIKGEYGEGEINWKEHVCKTHDKKLYNAIQKYLKEYEHLLAIRDRIAIFDSGTDPTEIWYPEYKEMLDKEYEVYQTCIKILTALLSKYLEVLWW